MNILPRRSRLPRLIVTLSILGAPPFFAQASPYILSFVTGVHDAADPALRIDVAGAPHLVYHALEASPILARYATYDGSNWSTEDVDTASNAISPPSLALANGVTPVIVDTDKFWAQWSAERVAPGSWLVESTQAHGGGQWGALAIDAAGTRHVLYAEGVNFSLGHTHRLSPNVWTQEDVLPDQTSPCRSTQLVRDPASNLHGCYIFASTAPAMRYTERVSGSWTFPEKIADVTVDAGPSMALGPDGISTVSYRHPTQGVVLAHRDGPANWNLEIADAQGVGPTSLAWDAAGRAHVAYVRAGAIWQAVRPEDGNWVREQVTSPGALENDRAPSLSLDPDGNASIAFVRESPRAGGGTERALGLAHDVKTLGADPGPSAAVQGIAIERIAPQPVRGEGRIMLRLAKATNVHLELIAIDGRRVAARDLGVLTEGPHAVSWAPGGLRSGVYILRAIGANGALDARRWVAL